MALPGVRLSSLYTVALFKFIFFLNHVSRAMRFDALFLKKENSHTNTHNTPSSAVDVYIDKLSKAFLVLVLITMSMLTCW